MKKYELTYEYITRSGFSLFRIRALVDIGISVRAGDLGGFVESEKNLSHLGSSWVGGNARVYGNATVSGDSLVTDESRVGGESQICGESIIRGNAIISGSALIDENASVRDEASVTSHAIVRGHASVGDHANITDHALIDGNAGIGSNAKIFCDTIIRGDTEIYCDAHTSYGALIESNEDILTITGLGTMHRTTTAYRTRDKEIMITCGCFRGGVKAFERQVISTRDGKVRKEYLKLAELIRIYFSK